MSREPKPFAVASLEGMKSASDRLIFTDKAGESVRAMDVSGGKVRVQITGPDEYSLTTVEIELKSRQAIAFALQILDAAGCSAEVKLLSKLLPYEVAVHNRKGKV